MTGNPGVYAKNRLYQLYGGNEPPFDVITEGDIWYVDGDVSASGDGRTWTQAFKTISEAVTAASAGDTILITPKLITDKSGDPTNYAETIIIPYAKSNLSLIGLSRGRTQGGLPQIKIGSGSTALITIRAPGCLIKNIGINGYNSTGGGILLDDDYSTKAAFGTSIIGCHFKECKCHATNGSLGGAIYTTSVGNCWQVLISGNNFYKCLADVVLVGTTNTQPQDWVIEDNVFSGPKANVDVNLFLTGAGDGVNGVTIRNNTFPCFPDISAGSNTKPMDLIGCTGILADNFFGWPTNGAGKKTMGATGDDINVPATVIISGNQGECDTELDTGIQYRTA